MPTLVLPSLQYKASYLEAVTEYQAEQRKNYLDLDIEHLRSNFEQYLQQIEAESKGIHLAPGYVPHTVYWLVEGTTFLGRVDIRHELNDFLRDEGGHIGYDIRPSERKKGLGSLALKLALEKAQELGLEEILLTCDVENIGSNKIIQKNGGQLSETKKLKSGLTKNKYWIR